MFVGAPTTSACMNDSFRSSPLRPVAPAIAQARRPAGVASADSAIECMVRSCLMPPLLLGWSVSRRFLQERQERASPGDHRGRRRILGALHVRRVDGAFEREAPLISGPRPAGLDFAASAGLVGHALLPQKKPVRTRQPALTAAPLSPNWQLAARSRRTPARDPDCPRSRSP